MRVRTISISMSVILAVLFNGTGLAQDFAREYAEFKKQAESRYGEFRKECNKKYIEFLKKSWERFESKPPIPTPKDDDEIPPRPYVKDEEEKESITPDDNYPVDDRINERPIEEIPIEETPIDGNPIEEPINSKPAIEPIEISPIEETPQPKPIEPIREITAPDENQIKIGFYGIEGKVRLPEVAKIKLKDCSPEAIAEAWGILSEDGLNNAIRDCLETRIRHNLCDWAYLMYLDRLGRQYCDDPNGATLLTAFLYCQSGYQMRLATDTGKLVMLYGTRHQQYDKRYYSINGLNFYPLGRDLSSSIRICNTPFTGETPMSLAIDKEQLLGDGMSEPRTIKSTRFRDLSVESRVPENLIKFYNDFPSSQLDGNQLTRWAIYANTPLAQSTKEAIYPIIKREVEGLTQLQAVEKILNLVQTGLTYGYDSNVWGHDRAFFSEETLFYPYSDCEDRAILFSRLVRDLIGIDVALVYYPNHLATAVCFDEDVAGDAMKIDGRKFTICDPTYIGAPVGTQMPSLRHEKTQAILLR
ncbi:MAG: hypothetical protein K2K98_06580 [Muribaculaceae bacterium]|nr:hypothetical protein [Muribaculaceae bacterium]